MTTGEINKNPDEGKNLWYHARRRFFRNKPAVAGLVYLLLCTLVAVFAFAFMPDNTRNANFQVREAASSPPGTVMTVLLRPAPAQEPDPGLIGFLIHGKPDRTLPIRLRDEKSWRIYRDSLHYILHSGMEVHTLLPVFILRPNLQHPQTAKWQQESGKPCLLVNDKLTWVDAHGRQRDTTLSALTENFEREHILTRTFLLGSDTSGRDVLSRLLLGARVSLSVGLMAVLVSLGIGITLGSLAGLFRGRVDTIIMWFVSVVWSIPTLLLAVSISFALGQGFWQLFIAIGVSMWVDVARMVRGQIFTLREMQYVEAARVLGYGPVRTLLRHVLPNALGPVLIVAAANFATAILLEAGLSFLGVGVKPPVPSWGTMIYEGYTQVMFDSGKWLAVFPGLAMVLLVISVNLVGFGLRDALDPRHEASV